MKQEGPLAHLLLIFTKRETGGFSKADCWQQVQEPEWEPKKQPLVSQRTSVSGLRIPAPEARMFSVHGLKGSHLSWSSLSPFPWEGSHPAPLPLSPLVTGVTQGQLYQKKRKPGSGLPPAQQAALPALFFFSLRQERLQEGCSLRKKRHLAS